jgi:hypothetical protein
MKDHIYCYAHHQMREARAKKFVLPALEDANAIQMAVMLVQRALIDDEITDTKAGLLLYSLQIAAVNVSKTTFGQAADEDMMTETDALLLNSYRPLTYPGEFFKHCRIVAGDDQARCGGKLLHAVLRAEV